MPVGRPLRKPLPTAEELLEEAKRQRRRERRAARAAKAKGEAAPVAQQSSISPASGPAPTDPESIRNMFNQAFMDLGGVDALVEWGRRYPKEFYPMWARLCIPKDSGETGDGGLEEQLAKLAEQEKQGE